MAPTRTALALRPTPSVPRRGARSGAAAVPILAGLAAAIVGAVVWATLVVVTEYEIGYVAWAIGGLVGFGVVVLGGRGTPLAVLAAVLAVLSIVGGKYATAYLMTDRNIEAAFDTQEAQEGWKEFLVDAQELGALGEEPDDAALADYMVRRGWTEAGQPSAVGADELDWFRTEHEERLAAAAADPPTFDEWKASRISATRKEYLTAPVLTEDVKASLGGIDALFALLGISTAFGIVMKRTAQDTAREFMDAPE
jgi:hypothetical protein